MLVETYQSMHFNSHDRWAEVVRNTLILNPRLLPMNPAQCKTKHDNIYIHDPGQIQTSIIIRAFVATRHPAPLGMLLLPFIILHLTFRYQRVFRGVEVFSPNMVSVIHVGRQC